MEEKRALSHDRLMLEEDRRDEFCGHTARLAAGRGGVVPGNAASLCPLPAARLCVQRDVCCVLVWGAQPLGGWSAPRAPLPFQKPVTWPLAAPEGAATDFFLGCLILTTLHCFLFILSNVEVLKVCIRSWKFPRWCVRFQRSPV